MTKTAANKKNKRSEKHTKELEEERGTYSLALVCVVLSIIFFLSSGTLLVFVILISTFH